MPTYSYECRSCGAEQEIIKRISEMESEEFCSKCETGMIRVISQVSINTSTCKFESHHNHAFGKTVTTKRQLEECRRKLQDQTGKQIVEVGTDDLKSVKRQRKKYTW